ncbi:unnamed protein product [Phytophthora lilii]|uniref:Unnamed protein product n=1 Tax=Phytophthora lilii TaxID=2077276 RepID=A0A9W6TS24_9STRA|nr:unnamed protein product [Phytophthora lilii]
MAPPGLCSHFQKLMMERTCVPRSTRPSKKPKLVADAAFLPSDAAAGRLHYVLELGTASVWDFMDAQSISNTLQVCAGAFAQDFVDSVALEAVKRFAVENKTHLGRHCECDWMRRLDFKKHYYVGCHQDPYFIVDENLPILQVSGGAKAFLDALLLTKKLMQPFESADRFRDATFAPMVCPLITVANPILRTKADVIRALNEVSQGAGPRLFYKFKLTRRYYCDYLEEHWGGMKDSSCEYCDSLTDLSTPKSKKYANLTSFEIQQICANCTKLYRPLKVALEKNLQFVNFIREPRRRGLKVTYSRLVAGVTEGGVLCGLFLVSGFCPRDMVA